jgi:hypothetical protein
VGGGSTVQPAAPLAVQKGIQVDKLGGIDTDSLGTLDAEHGGLGPDLWRGTPRPLASALVAALPESIASPSLRDLAHRLLLTTATPPEGEKGSGPSLLTLRARKLAEMGNAQGLEALKNAVPGHLNDEAITRFGIESSLAEGDTGAVCGNMPNLIRTYHDVFWQKVQVFCQALDKKRQQVDMGVGMLREENDANDPAYFTLIDALMGAKGGKVTSLAEPSPLIIAMMRAAKEAVPDDALRTRRPTVLRAIADSPNASSELRLSAAEHALLAGTLSGEALGKIYDGVQVSDAELAGALTKAQAQYGPRARVLLYRSAKAQTVPTARAEALAAALSLARSAGAYALAIAVNRALVEQVAPAPELEFFAVEAARALIYAGANDKADAWLALARQSSSASGAVAALFPYVILGGPRAGAWDNNQYLAWQAAQKASGADARLVELRAQRFLGLAAALGGGVTAANWQPFYRDAGNEPAAMPSVAVWQGLSSAAAAGRRGETVLMALLAVGAVSVENANPIALDGAIGALRAVGLEKDARRLAIEAAVAAGL